MRARQDPPPELLRLALHQAGVVTIAQALGTGMSREVAARLVREGRWAVIARGVLSTSPAPGWDALAWAGFLVAGEQSRLGPRSSGFVHGLVAEEPRPLDLLVPADSRVRVSGPWVFRRELPGARGTGTVGSPPRLGIEDTVVDLCAAGDEAEAVGWVTSAVQQHLTTARRLRAVVEARGRLRHRRLLLEMLADVAEGAESALELRYLRDVERAHGLPAGTRQRRHRSLAYRSDVSYDAYRVLVELDGRDGHVGTGRFRDMRRDNRFALRDLWTLRYGWFDVGSQPCSVAAQVSAALAGGGWTGIPTRCRRCFRLDASSWSLLR